jgi:hypothetical protein
LGWDYPYNNSLKDIIDKTKLYTITCLSTLLKNEKQYLLDKGIVLVKELIDNERLLSRAGINSIRIPKILDECSALCK